MHRYVLIRFRKARERMRQLRAGLWWLLVAQSIRKKSWSIFLRHLSTTTTITMWFILQLTEYLFLATPNLKAGLPELSECLAGIWHLRLQLLKRAGKWQAMKSFSSGKT